MYSNTNDLDNKSITNKSIKRSWLYLLYVGLASTIFIIAMDLNLQGSCRPKIDNCILLGKDKGEQY